MLRNVPPPGPDASELPLASLASGRMPMSSLSPTAPRLAPRTGAVPPTMRRAARR